jgi:hypothetical protein
VTDTPSPATPTLFDWAGGAGALRRLIDAFYDRVERDGLLAPFFPGGVSVEHRDHVTAWWIEPRCCGMNWHFDHERPRGPLPASAQHSASQVRETPPPPSRTSPAATWTTTRSDE